jgi:hypothetical protein
MVDNVPLAPAIAVIAVGVLNAQTVATFAIRAFNSAGNPQVRLRNMRLGVVGNTVMADTVVNAGFVLAQFGSGSEVSDNRAGFGAPLNTFRLQRPFALDVVVGDTFVIERPNAVINYGATNTVIIWAGGKTGFEAVKWSNAGVTPATVAFRFKDSAIVYEEGVEWALAGPTLGPGGTQFIEDESIVSAGFAEQVNLWANAGVNNPFGTAPSTDSPSVGRFVHDGNTLLERGGYLGGFVCGRNGLIDARAADTLIDLSFADLKRASLQVTTGGGLIVHAANNFYHGRVDGQTAISATLGLVRADGCGAKLNLQQLEILNSGGHAIAASLNADVLLARITGLFNAGVGLRATNGAEIFETLTTNFTVAGTAGDVQAGLNVSRTYASLTATSPINNEYDFAGDGSRVFVTGTAQKMSESRTGTVLIGAAFADIVFSAGFGAGVPVEATLNTVDATALEVVTAVWQGGTTLRVTIGPLPAVATAAVVVSATATHSRI